MCYKLSIQKNCFVCQLPYLVSVFIQVKIGDADKEIVNSKWKLLSFTNFKQKKYYLVQPGVEPGPPSLLPGAYHCGALGRAVHYTTEPSAKTNIKTNINA